MGAGVAVGGVDRAVAGLLVVVDAAEAGGVEGTVELEELDDGTEVVGEADGADVADRTAVVDRTDVVDGTDVATLVVVELAPGASEVVVRAVLVCGW